MASYNIGSIRAAIKALLTTVSSVAYVYDYMAPKVDGYPAIIFDLDNEDAQYLDSVNNTRTLTFKIWVACEIPVDGLQSAKTLLDGVTADVVNILEKLTNQTLSGTADWCIPVIGKRDQSNSPSGNFLYQELLLKVNVVSYVA